MLVHTLVVHTTLPRPIVTLYHTLDRGGRQLESKWLMGLKKMGPKNIGSTAWSNHIPRDLPSNLHKSLRLPGCSAPRSIQRPTQLRSPSSSSPSHSLGLGYVFASPRQLPLFTPRFFHLRCSSVWTRDLLRFQYQLRR